MALGGVHVGAAPVELALLGAVTGALPRPALNPFAVRRHRSSNGSKFAFSAAYHVSTE